MTKIIYAVIGIEAPDNENMTVWDAGKWAFDTLKEADAPDGYFVASLGNEDARSYYERISDGRDERETLEPVEHDLRRSLVDGRLKDRREGRLGLVQPPEPGQHKSVVRGREQT